MTTKTYDLPFEGIYKGYRVTQKLAHGEENVETTITHIETNKIVAKLEPAPCLVGLTEANKFIDTLERARDQQSSFKDNWEKLIK